MYHRKMGKKWENNMTYKPNPHSLHVEYPPAMYTYLENSPKKARILIG